MKVALLCPTVGQTRRGYERFITDLFDLLKADVDITLFKGAGASGPAEKVVPHIKRTGLLSRPFPHRFRYARSHLEFASFAIAMFPHLQRGGFDLVHFIDPLMGRWLRSSRRLASRRFGLLFTNGFTNGAPVPDHCSRWADHIHCVTPSALQETEEAGIPRERLTMLPPGVAPQRFVTPLDRDELRRRFDVPSDAFVILAITSLNRQHKRVDYLIEEVSRLEGNFLLWLDGSLHPDGDATLLQLASARLGTRFRHTHVPSDRVGELFKLADVMVSAALYETFGMALVEAMCCGLPVVAHDSPHFRWLVGSAEHLEDMRSTGNLAARLAQLMRRPVGLRNPIDPSDVVRRFGWGQLKAGYLEMYGRLAHYSY